MSVQMCYRIKDNIRISKNQLSTTFPMTITLFVYDYWLFCELFIYKLFCELFIYKKYLYDEVTDDIFDISNVRICNIKLGDVYTLI